MNEIADRLADAGVRKPMEEVGRVYVTEYDEDIPIIKVDQENEAIEGQQPLKDILSTVILPGLMQIRKRHLDRSTETYRRMTAPNSARRHFGKAITTLPARSAMRAIQIVTGTFPSRMRLKLWQKSESGLCPFCKTTEETTAHFSQACPQFREARTAAHDRVWGTTWTALKECLPSGWEAIHDTRMRDTPLLVDQEYSNMRPDGLLLNKQLGVIVIVETARCTGFSGADTVERRRKKEAKYDQLAQNITRWNTGEYNKGARVCALIYTFTGALDEQHWKTELQYVLTANSDTNDPNHEKYVAKATVQVDRIIGATVTAALEAFDMMADTRLAASRTLRQGQGTT